MRYKTETHVRNADVLFGRQKWEGFTFNGTIATAKAGMLMLTRELSQKRNSNTPSPPRQRTLNEQA